MSRILIMGNAGSGKTYLANCIVERLIKLNKTIEWFNADEIREKFNDWDFSIEGRIRQSARMHSLCLESEAEYQLCDFVAPLVEMRDIFDADITIWVDTIPYGRFEDTNKMFVPPTKYQYHIVEQNGEKYADMIVEDFIKMKQEILK